MSALNLDWGSDPHGHFLGCLLKGKCLNYMMLKSAVPNRQVGQVTTGYCWNCEALMAYEFEVQRERRRARQALESAIVKFSTKWLRNVKVR